MEGKISLKKKWRKHSKINDKWERKVQKIIRDKSWKNKLKGKARQRKEMDIDEIKFKEEIRSRKKERGMKEFERRRKKWCKNINETLPVLDYTQLKIWTKKAKYFQIQLRCLHLKVSFFFSRNWLLLRKMWEESSAEVHWIYNLWRTSVHSAESQSNGGN